MWGDDKGDVRNRIDLTRVNWKRVGTGSGTIEWAQIFDEDEPYCVLRGPNRAGETVVLVYDRGEWEAFVVGIEDGEFD